MSEGTKTGRVSSAGLNTSNTPKSGRTKRRETNVQFLKRLMDYSRTGAIMQGFIMDSIMKQAEELAATSLEEVRAQFKASGADSFINPDAWKMAAEEFKFEMEARLK